MRGEVEGWVRGTYRVDGRGEVEAYHKHTWGRDFYVDAELVDILPDEWQAPFLRDQLVAMLGDTGPVTP
jgi:hypothetical protein